MYRPGVRRLRTASVALTALIAVALPAVAGAQSGTYTPADIPGLIDPDFTVSPSRLAPGDTATVRLSPGWPTAKAPCTAAGTGSIAVVLAQGGKTVLLPLVPLADRRFRIALPGAETLRTAGIRRSGPATISAFVPGCAKRPTRFGRDDVTLVIPAAP